MMPLTIRGYDVEDEVSWGVAETPLVLAGSTQLAQTVLDFVADVVTTTGFDNNCALSIAPARNCLGYTADNLTPSVCVLSAADEVVRVTDGACIIEIASGQSKKRFIRDMLRGGVTTLYEQIGFAAGSLARHIVDQIDAMIVGKTASATTTRMLAGGVRNPDLFTGALDMSASSNAEWPIHLLTTRHFVAATHVCPAVGATVSWLDNSGNTVSATIVSKQSTDLAGDVTIGYLSAPIGGITPYYLLPDTWQNYLPPLASADNFGQIVCPILMALKDNPTGEREVRVGRLGRRPAAYPTSILSYDPDGYMAPSNYAEWSSALIGGDSGSAMVIPVVAGGLKTVLLCATWQKTTSANLCAHIAAINTAMNALAAAASDPAADTYAVQTVDLSGFNSYP